MLDNVLFCSRPGLQGVLKEHLDMVDENQAVLSMPVHVGKIYRLFHGFQKNAIKGLINSVLETWYELCVITGI
jgi:hypothetical protein